MARLIKYLELEDFTKILKAEKDRRYKLVYVLAFGSGLRISEILGPAKNSNQEIKPLCAREVNLPGKQIKVFGKGGKERVTVIHPYFPLRENMLNLLPLKINRRTMQYHFSKLTQKVLGRKLNFHRTRHGFGNFWLNVGVIDKKGVVRKMTLGQLQACMGHSRADTTLGYAQANPVTTINAIWEGF